MTARCKCCGQPLPVQPDSEPVSLAAIARANGIPVSIAGLVREPGAAALLDVSARTLRAWRMTGQGPTAVRVGGAWRYHVDVLTEYLLAQSGRTRQNPAIPDIDAASSTDDDEEPKFRHGATR